MENLFKASSRLASKEWPRNKALAGAAVQPLVAAAQTAGLSLKGDERSEHMETFGLCDDPSATITNAATPLGAASLKAFCMAYAVIMRRPRFERTRSTPPS